MPGRFTITKEENDLLERFDATIEKDVYNKRYNVSPTQSIPVIISDDPSRIIFARWGWNPKFAGHTIVNARSEGIHENRLFGKAFRERRCVILMDGYYEWEDTPDGKKPYRIKLKDGTLFAVAGVWIEENDEIHVATITTSPNELVKKIHHRMPAILEKNDEKTWLDKDSEHETLLSILKPYPHEMMEYYRVSTQVNSSRHDKKEYIEELSAYQEKREDEHQMTLGEAIIKKKSEV